jgi:inosine-uridine nucleoside N-ribohydrolase
MQILYTGVYLHDPTTVVAAINPSLLTYTEGVVRVQTCGITRGLTLFDNTKKRSLFYTALFVFFFFSFLLSCSWIHQRFHSKNYLKSLCITWAA